MEKKNILERLGFIEKIDKDDKKIDKTSNEDLLKEDGLDISDDLSERLELINNEEYEEDIEEIEEDVEPNPELNKILEDIEKEIVKKTAPVSEQEPIKKDINEEKPKVKEETIPNKENVEKIINDTIAKKEEEKLNSMFNDTYDKYEEELSYDLETTENTIVSVEDVYKKRQLDKDINSTIFIAEEYMKALPENLPNDVKRESTLNIIKASRIKKDDLLNDAYVRIDALNTVLEDTVSKTASLKKMNEEKIDNLNKRILELRETIKERFEYEEKQTSLLEYEIQRIINIVDRIK